MRTRNATSNPNERYISKFEKLNKSLLRHSFNNINEFSEDIHYCDVKIVDFKAAFDGALQVNLFIALTVSFIHSNVLANVSNTLMAQGKIKHAKEMLLSLRFW